MPSINVDRQDKEEFDELKPEDMTQKEFFTELLAAYRRDNGEIVNVGEIVDQITKETAASVELASYRGTREAIQSINDRD